MLPRKFSQRLSACSSIYTISSIYLLYYIMNLSYRVFNWCLLLSRIENLSLMQAAPVFVIYTVMRRPCELILEYSYLSH